MSEKIKIMTHLQTQVKPNKPNKLNKPSRVIGQLSSLMRGCGKCLERLAKYSGKRTKEFIPLSALKPGSLSSKPTGSPTDTDSQISASDISKKTEKELEKIMRFTAINLETLPVHIKESLPNRNFSFQKLEEQLNKLKPYKITHQHLNEKVILNLADREMEDNYINIEQFYIEFGYRAPMFDLPEEVHWYDRITYEPYHSWDQIIRLKGDSIHICLDPIFYNKGYFWALHEFVAPC